MIIFESRNIEAVECVLYKISLEIDYINRNEFEVGGFVAQTLQAQVA